jgi:hypothetical protein
MWDGHTCFMTSDWEKKEWIRTPGFRGMDRKHLPDNPYYHGTHRYEYANLVQTATSYAISNGGFSHAVQWSMSSGDYVELGPESLDFPLDHPENNKAIADLQQNASAAKGSLAVSGAEIHKSLSLVGDTVLKLVRAKKALFTGRFGLFCDTLGITKSRKTRAYGRKFSKEMREAKKMGRENGTYDRQLGDLAAKTWLEFTYGWKPLIKDVYDQFENLSTLLTRNEGEVFMAIGKAKNEKYRERFVQNDGLVTVIKKAKWDTRTRFKIRYALTDLGYRNVFGLNNPALVAWEVVPFSFVVDWFLPIGQFIEGLTAYDGVAFRRGTRVQMESWQAVASGAIRASPVVDGPYHTYWTFSTADFGVCRSWSITRTVITEWPHQTFPEVFKDASSLSHAASALALLHRNFKGNRGSSHARYR